MIFNSVEERNNTISGLQQKMIDEELEEKGNKGTFVVLSDFYGIEWPIEKIQ